MSAAADRLPQSWTGGQSAAGAVAHECNLRPGRFVIDLPTHDPQPPVSDLQPGAGGKDPERTNEATHDGSIELSAAHAIHQPHGVVCGAWRPRTAGPAAWHRRCPRVPQDGPAVESGCRADRGDSRCHRGVHGGPSTASSTGSETPDAERTMYRPRRTWRSTKLRSWPVNGLVLARIVIGTESLPMSSSSRPVQARAPAGDQSRYACLASAISTAEPRARRYRKPTLSSVASSQGMVSRVRKQAGDHRIKRATQRRQRRDSSERRKPCTAAANAWPSARSSVRWRARGVGRSPAGQGLTLRVRPV